METTEQAIRDIVDANGGRVLYAALLEQLQFEHRQHLPKALRALKSRGEIQKQNRVENGQPIFEVFRMPS